MVKNFTQQRFSFLSKGEVRLKDKKGRILSDEDILHYQKIVIALAETIKLMAIIDETIPSFPIE